MNRYASGIRKTTAKGYTMDREHMFRHLWIDQTAILELYAKHIDPVCEKHNLNRIEMSILLFLSKHPQLNRAADIVKYKGFSKSYVSLSVKTLSERGLIEGRKMEGDRKNIFLSLLPLSEEIVQEGLEAQKDFCTVIYEGLSEEEIRQFFSYAQKIGTNVKKASAPQKETKTKRCKKA